MLAASVGDVISVHVGLVGSSEQRPAMIAAKRSETGDGNFGHTEIDGGGDAGVDAIDGGGIGVSVDGENGFCLLYTSDAADELDGVDLGGRRIIKKIF